MTKINIFIENEYRIWEPDEKVIQDYAKRIFEYYCELPEINQAWCLMNYEYDSITFDFYFCNRIKTHEINRDYRQKDYPADIITFAFFADSQKEDRIVIDRDINLGEIVLALDKIEEEAEKKEIKKEEELTFLISHGILHLLGFDHQTEEDYNFVVDCQKRALKNIGIKYDKI